MSKNLDHLGLVAGMCDELGLVSLIERRLSETVNTLYGLSEAEIELIDYPIER